MGRSNLLTTCALIGALSVSSSSQLKDNAFGFGIKVGQLSSVHLVYSPSSQLQLSASMGPLNSISEEDYIMPHNVSLSGLYFLSEGRSSTFVGLDLFTADNRKFKYGVAIPVGMQYWVTSDIALFGHFSTAKTDQMDSLTMFLGFGATFYLNQSSAPQNASALLLPNKSLNLRSVQPRVQKKVADEIEAVQQHQTNSSLEHHLKSKRTGAGQLPPLGGSVLIAGISWMGV